MSPKEAIKAVAILCVAYPDGRMTDATVDLYESLLSDLDYEVARKAIEHLVRTSKFLPKISEILDAAADITVGPCRSGVEAWGDVKKAIRHVGSYDYPTFDDPLVADCVRIMGWRDLCLGDSPEAADRARFCELYADLQRKRRMYDVSEPRRLLPAADDERALPSNVRELARKVGK